jgi:hypothetical protein
MAECLGSVNNATLESITVKKTAKGKQWAQVLLGFPGNVEVRAVCFEGKNPQNNPITDLEAYVPGEKIPNIFGSISSDFKDDGKVYTNLRIAKVGTEAREKSGFRVTGRVTNVGKTQYAHYIDVDTTDGDYESAVRLELPKDTKSNPFRVGQKVRDLTLAPRGKYGTWTLTSVPEGSAASDDAEEGVDQGGQDETTAPARDKRKRNLDI